MSRRSYRGLVLRSSASLALATASIMLHSVGCLENDSTASGDSATSSGIAVKDKGIDSEGIDSHENYDDGMIRGIHGACPKPGPCDDDTSGCENETNTYPLRKPNAKCNLGRNEGKCDENANCILACASNSSDCACSVEGGVVEGCPMTTECLKWGCDAQQHCQRLPQTGAVIKALDPGPCQQMVCTADGNPMVQPDITDKPAAMDACHVGDCDGMTPKQNFQLAGQPCAPSPGQTGVCNGAGTCVTCIEVKSPTNGCDPGEVCYMGSGGQPACTHCTNGKQDPGEVGVDCGGICALNKAGATPTCKLGAVCSAGTDCANGNCVDGVCCGTACTDPCKSCSEGIAGSGICSDVPTGTMDSSCAAGRLCVVGAGGKCLGTADAICSQNDQCMSGSCPNSVCVPGVAGKPCANDKDCVSGSTCKPNHICG